MHYILVILLGLSLPALADQTAQQQELQKDVQVEPACDPKKETKMPEFN